MCRRICARHVAINVFVFSNGDRSMFSNGIFNMNFMQQIYAHDREKKKHEKLYGIWHTLNGYKCAILIKLTTVHMKHFCQSRKR